MARPSLARAALVALLLAGSACAGGDAEAEPPSSTTTEAPATTAPAPPESWTGPLDGFYEVPDPLPAGEPGQLIRAMEVASTPTTRTVRVMYHSRDAQDRDRAVTGIVTHPTGEAPADGWPVVSWAHGTTGLVSECAPSRRDAPAPGFGVEGVHVATDYVGLGPVGEVHPYLSKPSEGNAVIDAVRAARQLPEAHAGTRWLSVGHSQGGHGALAAHELAAEHAPELDLVGTVAFAPAAVFEETYGGIDDIVTAIVTFMSLYGAVDEVPGIELEDYLTPEALAVAPVIEEECLDGIQSALLGVGIGPDALYADDPRWTEPAASLMADHDVGLVAVDAPLLLVSGTADDRVVIERVRALYDRLCDVGQDTELVVVDGANHGDIIPRTSEKVTTWLQDRLADRPSQGTCP